MSLATKIADKCNTLYSLITNTNKEVSSNTDSSITGNGYMEVSGKLDNFEFLEDANTTYKVVDKNRYVKIGDKVIDTYGDELVENGDFSDGINGFTAYTSGLVIENGTAKTTKTGFFTVDSVVFEIGKVYKISISAVELINGCNFRYNTGETILNFEKGYNEVVFTAKATNLQVETVAGVSIFDNISVKEVQVADFTNTAPNVTVVTSNAGVTGSKGDYFIDDVELLQSNFASSVADFSLTNGTGTLSSDGVRAHLVATSANTNFTKAISVTSGVELKITYEAEIGTSDYLQIIVSDSNENYVTFNTADSGVIRKTITFTPNESLINISLVGSNGDVYYSTPTIKRVSETFQATRNTVDMFDYTTDDGLVDYVYNTVIKVGNNHHVNVSTGDFYVAKYQTGGNFDFSNFDFTSDVNFTYLGTASAMSLDNPYFRDREDYGVTHQALAYHAWNTVSKSYEGIKTEILLNDMSVFATPKIVMEANEFTEVGSFLYQKGEYLCVPVVRTQMRNEGAYHPVYNPKGCAFAKHDANPTGDTATWYSQFSSINSLDDAFTKVYSADNSLPISGSGKVGRSSQAPDGKFYDVVYANDTIDMREFAKKATQFDIDLLRQDKIDNAVKNETTMASMVSRSNGGNACNISGTSITIFTAHDILSYDYTKVEIGDIFYLTDGVGNVVKGFYNGGILAPTDLQLEIIANNGFSGGVTPQNGSVRTFYINTNPIITSYSIDLIGDPANYPAMITDRLDAGLSVNGMYPLLVNQDGSSALPDGTSKTYTYSKKSLSPSANEIKTENGGATYEATTRTTNAVLNSSPSLGFPAPAVIWHSYETSNDPYEVTDSLSVIDVEPKVIASNSHSIYKGAKIASQIAGKITTGNGSRGLESKTLENAEIKDTKIYVASENNKTIDIKTGEIVLVDASTGNSSYYTIGHYYEAKEDMTGNPYTISGLTAYTNTSFWIEYSNRPTIQTTPEHNAIALDKEVSATGKWFNVLEEDDYSVHAGIFGQEMVWDSTRDEVGKPNFGNITSDTSRTYTKGNNYALRHSSFGAMDYKLIRVLNTFTVTAGGLPNLGVPDGTGKIRNISTGKESTWFELWDGTGFGDSGEFSNLSNTTSTDFNGKTVRSVHGSLALNIKR